MRKLFAFLLLFIFITCELHSQVNSEVELRGVWMASVANIDWPSRKGLDKAEFVHEVQETVKFYKDLNFNTIFLQVRPCSDVFYISKLEPWSKYINGTQGLGPEYDPLQIWLDEAHRKDIEVHAWLNPYRITQSNTDTLANNHPALKHPEWTVKYGDKLYFNPAIPEVDAHINEVVEELVENYRIDGIHIDDYFYPYPVNGVEFPDSIEYAQRIDTTLSVSDWRRLNVSTTIKHISKTIRNTNSNVKFGISPFGVWRNSADDSRGSNTMAGVTNYDDLYADILLWLKNGWIDYVTPQIYWTDKNKAAPYNHLVDWWAQNSYGSQVYIGHAIYKVGNWNSDWNDPTEISKQILKVRNTSNVSGSVFFSHKDIVRNRLGVKDSIANLYKHIALVPPIERIGYMPVYSPYKLKYNRKRDEIRWKSEIGPDFKCFAIFVQNKKGEEYILCKSVETTVSLKEFSDDIQKVYIKQVNKYNKTSSTSETLNISNKRR